MPFLYWFRTTGNCIIIFANTKSILSESQMQESSGNEKEDEEEYLCKDVTSTPVEAPIFSSSPPVSPDSKYGKYLVEMGLKSI